MLKFDRYGLFTLLDTDSDPDPGIGYTNQKWVHRYSNVLRIQTQIAIQVRVRPRATVSVQYNVAIGFGVRIPGPCLAM